jgi:hypothetical protein
MYHYANVYDAINDLQKRGYVYDFNLEEDCLNCPEADIVLKPSEFEIKEVYRFEGESDPDDNAIVYAIESRKGLKGILINAYGLYADPVSSAMVSKLHIETV